MTGTNVMNALALRPAVRTEDMTETALRNLDRPADVRAECKLIRSWETTAI